LVTNNNGLPSFFRFWKANRVPLEEILNLPPPPSPMNFGGGGEERRGEERVIFL
jgi:hypothetical protein